MPSASLIWIDVIGCDASTVMFEARAGVIDVGNDPGIEELALEEGTIDPRRFPCPAKLAMGCGTLA